MYTWLQATQFTKHMMDLTWEGSTFSSLWSILWLAIRATSKWQKVLALLKENLEIFYQGMNFITLWTHNSCMQISMEEI